MLNNHSQLGGILLDGYAMVTGAASGIGFATAVEYARSGIHGIALMDINETGLGIVAQECRKAALEDGFQILELVVDVTSEQQVREALVQCTEKFGRLDYATNAAGEISTSDNELVNVPLQTFDNMMALNARGTFVCVQEEIRAMRNQEFTPSHLASFTRPASRGSIVNVASLSGIGATRNAGAYITSKHAVVGLTKAAAIDHAADKIRVNAVCPGWVSTPLLDRIENYDIHMRRQLEAKIPLKRFATPEEIAGMCVFLSSHVSSYVTGCIIPVDGGLSLSVGG